jgi:DNA-binding IclR family transcriptional regulator
MIYSRSAEYAIRAFVHLAQVNEGKYAMVKNIAEQEDIPAHFLAKILQQLARKGLLRSSKGPTGGFALRVDPVRFGCSISSRHSTAWRRTSSAPAAFPNATTTCPAPCTIAG